MLNEIEADLAGKKLESWKPLSGGASGSERS